MFNVMGLFAIIPAMMLLTVSFFVLFTARKAESRTLKTFGHVIAVLLWISSALVFGAGIYMMNISHYPTIKARMMGGKASGPMMKGSMMKGRMMKGPMGGADIEPGMNK